MKGVIEKEVNGEIVYLKKNFDGWKVVFPIKNRDGTYNWKHLITGGSWWNLAKIGFFILIFLLAVFEWRKSLEYCSEFIANQTQLPFPQLNFSNFNFTR